MLYRQRWTLYQLKHTLKKMNSMLFSYFFRGCFKVQCSLKQPKYIYLMKKKSPLDLTCDLFLQILIKHV